QPDQHSPDVEPCQAERGTIRCGAPILTERGLELPVSLEDLSQIIVCFGIDRIDRNGPAIRILRLVPLLLKSEQDTIVVVKFGKAAPQGNRRSIVFVGLRPVSRPAI